MLIAGSALPGSEKKDGEDQQRNEKSDLSEKHEKDAEERQQRRNGDEERCLSHLS